MVRTVSWLSCFWPAPCGGRPPLAVGCGSLWGGTAAPDVAASAAEYSDPDGPGAGSSLCSQRTRILEDVRLRGLRPAPPRRTRPHAAVPRHGDLNAPGSTGQLRSENRTGFSVPCRSPDTARAPRAIAPTAQLAFERFAEAHDVSQERLDVC